MRTLFLTLLVYSLYGCGVSVADNSIQFSTNSTTFEPSAALENDQRLNDYISCLVVETSVGMTQGRGIDQRAAKRHCSDVGQKFYEAAYFASYDESFYEKFPQWKGRITERHRHNMARKSILLAESRMFENLDRAIKLIEEEASK